MREIKFRAYFEGRLVPVTILHFPHLYANSSEVEGNLGAVPVMQYTGLKDKNGKEIYQDDLVMIWYRGKKEGIYQVAWNQEHCCFMMGRMLEDDADTVYFGNQFDFEYEVVGNSYENSYLFNIDPNVQASVATESDSSNEADKQNQTP